MSVVVGCVVSTTDREAAKVSMTMKTAGGCPREVREGAIQWKGPCPIVPAGTVATLLRCHHTQRPGGGTVHVRLWSKEACPVHQQDNFPPLTYKTIAAGRDRGCASSIKEKKTWTKKKIIILIIIIIIIFFWITWFQESPDTVTTYSQRNLVK